MITFRKITYKNFLSAGNDPISIDLNKHDLSLICGQNGCGKSSILCGLTFALYGRPYRNINKPQLINSINQKHMLVTLEFDIGKKKYKVVRGMKPNVFEIYENNKLINQDPTVKDYQKVLEQQILKINYRAFTQVVVIGSGYYVPFMKLKPAERREFIEDLLDIKIFTVMNGLLKEQIKSKKDELKDIDTEIKMIREKFKMQESFIDKIKKEQRESTDKLNAEIQTLEEQIETVRAAIQKLETKIDKHMQSCESYENINDRLSEVKQHQRTLRKDIDKYNEEKSFYDNIHECPQCKQSIGSDHREHIIGTVDQNIQKLHEELVGIEDTLETLGEEYAKWQKCLSVIAELNSSMSALNKEIHGYSVEIKSKKKLLDSTDTTSLEEETVKLKAFAKDIVVRDKQKKEMLDVTAYQNVIYGLLQDSGIKSRVIKQYIPIINKLVNKYLESLDFFVNFTLDENFNEVIKSRHRDTFTYDSFSEGQKMRTDLALIFAWRELARLKNSVNTNLVFFDEILDGSLDENGISLVFQLLRSMKNTNVFVISHREAIADKFDNSLEFELRNGFSQLV